MDRLTHRAGHRQPTLISVAPPGQEGISGRCICTVGAVLRKQGVVSEPDPLARRYWAGIMCCCIICICEATLGSVAAPP